MTDATSLDLSRRSILAAGPAMGALFGAGAVQAAPQPLDIADPRVRLRLYMMMRGTLDDRLVGGFITGRYYGVVEEQIRPLFGVVGATFARYRARSDGGYAGASYEVAFFTDLETGEAMERWLNPYTSETVDVPHTTYPPAAIVIGPDLTLTVPNAPPGLVVQDRVVAPVLSGPDVWMNEQTTSVLTLPNLPRPVRYSELVSLHAERAAFEAPGVQRVPCQTSYTSVVSWRPWMKMGDRPGHLIGNGVGRYGAPMDEFPAAWTGAAARFRPDVLKTPAAPLVGVLDG